MEKKYSEVLDYLYNQLPVFQKQGAAAYKNSLDNTIALDELFAHPHTAFKSVHIAGTNGKGSVSHMIASIFQEAGYCTGLYTSPHLVDFRERIRVNGEMIAEKAVIDFVDYFRNKQTEIMPSFFELTMMMAFDYFRAQKVDIAIIEVGLGGRLDSTNVITPEVSVITNISTDHTGLLGKTIPLIAGEKAGIIKSGVPVVISESNNSYNSIFQRKAAEMHTDLYFADKNFHCFSQNPQTFNFTGYPDLQTDLPGIYQEKNIAGVLMTLELLKKKGWKLNNETIYNGLKKVRTNTGLRGRWEIMSEKPMIVCDTGHNEGGLQYVVRQLHSTPHDKLHIIFGMVNDKDVDSILRILPKEAVYYFTNPDIPRKLDAVLLKQEAQKLGLEGKTFQSVKEAVNAALENSLLNDLIFIGGSTFVVADYLLSLSTSENIERLGS